MAVYIPCGHGGENLDTPRKTIPDGCSLIVIETCGGAHRWSPNENGEIFEYKQLTQFLREHPDQRHIFSNPKENAAILNDIFGSVAIYGPDEKYPNITYTLELSWSKPNLEIRDIRYSGLIPFDSFVSPEFTTKNIVEKLFVDNVNVRDIHANIKKERFPYIPDLNLFENRDIWLKNQLEVYKYSVYPSVHDFDMILPEPIPPEQEESAKTLYKLRKRSLESTMIRNVSLHTLMTKFPGNYIHIVCRGLDDKAPPEYRTDVVNHTKEELFLKRLPYMTGNQKRRAIENINQAMRLKKKSRFTIRSTKFGNNNILLTGLKKSVMQNELLSKVAKKEGGMYKKTRRNRR